MHSEITPRYIAQALHGIPDMKLRSFCNNCCKITNHVTKDCKERRENEITLSTDEFMHPKFDFSDSSNSLSSYLINLLKNKDTSCISETPSSLLAIYGPKERPYRDINGISLSEEILHEDNATSNTSEYTDFIQNSTDETIKNLFNQTDLNKSAVRWYIKLVYCMSILSIHLSTICKETFSCLSYIIAIIIQWASKYLCVNFDILLNFFFCVNNIIIQFRKMLSYRFLLFLFLLFIQSVYPTTNAHIPILECHSTRTRTVDTLSWIDWNKIDAADVSNIDITNTETEYCMKLDCGTQLNKWV